MNTDQGHDRSGGHSQGDSERPPKPRDAAGGNEPWLGLSTTDRNTASYQAGRLLNLLGLRLALSLFSGRSENQAEVDEVVGRLKGVSHILSTSTEAAIADEIEAAIGEFRPKTEQDADNLLSGLDWLCDEGDPFDASFIPAEDRYRDLVAGWVEPVINAIRQALQERLNSEESWLLLLGETVDQGLRRFDVCTFMHRQYRVRPEQILQAPDEVGPGEDDDYESEDTPSEEGPLASSIFTSDRSHCGPGKVPPKDGWLAELPGLCAKAGIPDAIAPYDISLPSEPSREQVLAVVEQADGRIRKKLAESGETARSIVNPQEQQDQRARPTEEFDAACHSESSRQIGPAPRDSQGELRPREFQRLRKLKKGIDSDDTYIGDSPVILRVFERIAEFNKSPNVPILIQGPRGSGKTEIAKRIHLSSERKEGRFLTVSATDAMANDEAFARQRWLGYGPSSGIQDGDEKGSPGLLKDYEGGTVFIDEVADLPEWFQLLLFPVLDEGEVNPFAGKAEPFKPDVRLIFATNRDLSVYMAKNRFRDDFFGRIKHNTLKIPPLSERPEDVFSFVHSRCSRRKRTEGFLLCLLRYSWPDNVRELLRVLDKAVAKTSSDRDTLGIEHIELVDMSVVDGVKSMSDTEQEREVYRFLAQTLERQGFRKKKGGGQALYARMGTVLCTSQSTVSRKAKAYL